MSTEASPLLPKHAAPAPGAAPGAAPAGEGSTTAQQLTGTTDERVQPPLAPEEEPDLRSPEEKRASLRRWLAFWLVLAGAVVFCVVEAIKEGGGEIDWKGALKKAGGGGLAGALAMVLQVLTLMPLRTVMNFQYRYGGTMVGSIKTLFADRGLARFYDGLGPALFQGPISRFGDTAANAGILALLASNPFLNRLPSPMKTAFASVAGALFRMILVPVDTLKTTMQTRGAPGVQLLKDRVRKYGVGTLWYGAWATAAASFVGSFPWFATYNWLSAALPAPSSQLEKLLRQAFIGFAASVVSDTISNSLRVVKTYRQVHEGRVSYTNAAKSIIASEGVWGLFGRGLGTRVLANGLQGLMFSVLWKYLQDAIEHKK